VSEAAAIDLLSDSAVHLAVDVVSGLPDAIDEAAARAVAGHAFLRRAWYEAAGASDAATLIARRRDGSLLAAIPTVPAGPPILGARAVPGSYWPFRGVPIDAEATEAELRALLGLPAARAALGPVWRLGPVYRDTPIKKLLAAARGAGWIVLQRPLGSTFLLDIPAAKAQGEWPRKSTMRKIRRTERQLAEEGPLAWRFVRGSAWDGAAFYALAAIEGNSWVATDTDGSGAKFLRPEQRACWEQAVRDPVLADMLSAAILTVGDRPAAFSFDLNVGRLQYGIAGSYDARFARHGAGKIVTYRHLEESAARGIELVDWGAGDSGYKREIGAAASAEIVDLLIVRHRSVAAMLKPRWERPIGQDGGKIAADNLAGDPFAGWPQILIAALVATAAAAMGE
jgi:hypothetical protein